MLEEKLPGFGSVGLGKIIIVSHLGLRLEIPLLFSVVEKAARGGGSLSALSDFIPGSLAVQNFFFLSFRDSFSQCEAWMK